LSATRQGYGKHDYRHDVNRRFVHVELQTKT
jgi:hypothetical protein